MSHAAPTHHFGDKTGLLTAVAIDGYRTLARELGPFNIRVNAVSPGAIPTALEREVWADQLETYVEFLVDHQALKYRGSPEDIANAILFLISDKAHFITGQNLGVDGGWWMH